MKNVTAAKFELAFTRYRKKFENGRNLDGKNSLQHFDAKEAYLHPKSRSVSFQKCLKMFCFHHFQVFTRCRFQNVSVRVPFQNLPFSNLPAKNVPFSCEGEAYPSNFSPFKNVPALCERTLISSLGTLSSQDG